MSVGLGARRAAALAVGDVAWGLAFGALARATGLTLAEAATMSGGVYAGTAQMAALGIWTARPAAIPLGAVVLTTLVVNLRNLMLGVALAPWLAHIPARQAYAAAFFVTDETYALTAAERQSTDRGGPTGPRLGAGFLFGSGIVFWVTWVGSAVAGHWGGALVRDPARWALDFGAVAAMLVLLCAVWRGRGTDALPWTAAGVVALAAARILPGQWYIVLGAFAGCATGAWRDLRSAAPHVEVRSAP